MSADKFAKVSGMAAKIILWIMGVGYVAIGILKVHSNGLMTEGSPRELVISTVIGALFAGAGILARRSSAKLANDTDSPAVMVFKSLMLTGLWLGVGVVIFSTQLVVY